MNNPIPQLSLELLKNKDPHTISLLEQALEQHGFFTITDHGLEDRLLEQSYEASKNFFNLPLNIKNQYAQPQYAGARGYTHFGKETALGESVADLKEFWHFGQDLDAQPKLKGIYPNNIHVKELQNFNKVGNEVYKKLEKTAEVLLQAIALYLELDAFYFDSYIREGNSILRAIHYPPITKAPNEAERAAAHGDINLITLLMGSQGGGLQVLNRNQEWIDAIAGPDELMINIGDMLSRLTNNHLPSTIHRVVNPPPEEWGNARYSLPFFMHPIPQMPLNCLPQMIDAAHPKKYEDIDAGTFLHQRLVALGLLK